MNLRSIASAVSVLLASVAFIATPAPPVYTVSKKEQSNTVVLSPQSPTVEKKVMVTLDTKKIGWRVEKNLREDTSAISIVGGDGATVPGLTVEIKYPDGNPTKGAPYSSRWLEQPAKNELASASIFENCDLEAPCRVEVVVVFSASNLTEEVSVPWLLRVYLSGIRPTKNERQQEKAEQAITVSIQ